MATIGKDGYYYRDDQTWCDTRSIHDAGVHNDLGESNLSQHGNALGNKILEPMIGDIIRIDVFSHETEHKLDTDYLRMPTFAPERVYVTKLYSVTEDGIIELGDA